MWKNRLVIPEPRRKELLNELHEAHIGMTKMKSLSHMYLWSPKINDDIEKMVTVCLNGREHQPEAISTPLQPWKWPNSLWNRIHVDHAGPFLNLTFLIIVDSHTKWVEIFQLSKTINISTVTIKCLQTTFTQFGLPQTIVSDNGSSFTSREFQKFVKPTELTMLLQLPINHKLMG